MGGGIAGRARPRTQFARRKEAAASRVCGAREARAAALAALQAKEEAAVAAREYDGATKLQADRGCSRRRSRASWPGTGKNQISAPIVTN